MNGNIAIPAVRMMQARVSGEQECPRHLYPLWSKRRSAAATPPPAAHRAGILLKFTITPSFHHFAGQRVRRAGMVNHRFHHIAVDAVVDPTPASAKQTSVTSARHHGNGAVRGTVRLRYASAGRWRLSQIIATLTIPASRPNGFSSWKKLPV